MREYEVTAKWIVEWADNIDRDYIIQDITQDLEEITDDNNLRVDIQVLPRGGQYLSGADVTEEMLLETPDHMSGAQTTGLIPEMGITHPWDQGSWIFPADHPLREVEAYFRARHSNTTRGEIREEAKRDLLEAGQLMLPKGSDEEEES
jgi:hypothetical protein